MNKFSVATTNFFDMLRKRKWGLYIPERVYRAHKDGLLTDWGINNARLLTGDDRRYRGGCMGSIKSALTILDSQGDWWSSGLKIPLLLSGKDEERKRDLMDRFWSHVTPYEETERCFPLPEISATIITFDMQWQNVVAAKISANRILEWDGWVYRLRFYPIWVDTGEKYIGPWALSNVPPSMKREELERKAQEIRDKRRILRKDYGLTSEYNKCHKATLIVLKEAFPPERVRKMRRQLEDRLRKDPAEVIRLSDRVRR